MLAGWQPPCTGNFRAKDAVGGPAFYHRADAFQRIAVPALLYQTCRVAAYLVGAITPLGCVVHRGLADAVLAVSKRG